MVSPLAGCLTSLIGIECRMNLLRLSNKGIKIFVLKVYRWASKRFFFLRSRLSKTRYIFKSLLFRLPGIDLRTSLCKNQTTWQTKMYAVRHSGGMHKNALFKGRSTLVAMVTTAACSRPGASFSYKNVAKEE